MTATNPLLIPELLDLIIGSVDEAKVLHACCQVNHSWFRASSKEARRRLDEARWLNPVSPDPFAYSYSASATTCSAEQQDWENNRWWLRLHGDSHRFLQQSALQFTYVPSSNHLIFRDSSRKFHNTPTQSDCFPVRGDPYIFELNLSLLWWEDFDIMLREQCQFEGIFGYTGSLAAFTRDDISQILCLNAAWYLYSFEERAFLSVMVLKDGRFVFILEGATTGTIDSSAFCQTRCIFASSLQMLLFFGLGDANRATLGIKLGNETDEPKKKKKPEPKPKMHATTKKIKMKMRWSSEPTPTPEELEEEKKLLKQYLTFPFYRVRGYISKLGVEALDYMLRWRESPDHIQTPNELEYDAATVLPGHHLRPQQREVLYNPKWSEEEKKEKDQRYLQEWQEVWLGCGGFHMSLAWNDEEGDAEGSDQGEEGEFPPLRDGTTEDQPAEDEVKGADAMVDEGEWHEERGWAVRQF